MDFRACVSQPASLFRNSIPGAGIINPPFYYWSDDASSPQPLTAHPSVFVSPPEPEVEILPVSPVHAKVNNWMNHIPMFCATDGAIYPDCYTLRASSASSSYREWWSLDHDDIVQSQARQVTRCWTLQYLNDGERAANPAEFGASDVESEVD